MCSRPAVSTSTASYPRLRATRSASVRTADGSAPSAPRWKGDSVRRAQTSSCSAAAARKVSAAQTSVVRPSAFQARASFPMVVVFPTPFTPTTNTTQGWVENGRTASGRSSDLRISSRSSARIAGTPPVQTCELRSRSTSIASWVAAIPKSDAISASSIASRSSGFSGRRPRTRSSTSAFRMSRVRSSPLRNRSRNAAGRCEALQLLRRCGGARSRPGAPLPPARRRERARGRNSSRP